MPPGWSSSILSSRIPIHTAGSPCGRMWNNRSPMSLTSRCRWLSFQGLRQSNTLLDSLSPIMALVKAIVSFIIIICQWAPDIWPLGFVKTSLILIWDGTPKVGRGSSKDNTENRESRGQHNKPHQNAVFELPPAKVANGINDRVLLFPIGSCQRFPTDISISRGNIFF